MRICVVYLNTRFFKNIATRKVYNYVLTAEMCDVINVLFYDFAGRMENSETFFVTSAGKCYTHLYYCIPATLGFVKRSTDLR